MDKADEAQGPVVARFDLIQQPCKHHERIVETTGLLFIEVAKQEWGLFTWERKGESKVSIPEAGVVSTDVSYNSEMMQEGSKCDFIKSISISDSLTICRSRKIIVEGG